MRRLKYIVNCEVTVYNCSESFSIEQQKMYNCIWIKITFFLDQSRKYGVYVHYEGKTV